MQCVIWSTYKAQGIFGSCHALQKAVCPMAPKKVNKFLGKTATQKKATAKSKAKTLKKKPAKNDDEEEQDDQEELLDEPEETPEKDTKCKLTKKTLKRANEKAMTLEDKLALWKEKGDIHAPLDLTHVEQKQLSSKHKWALKAAPEVAKSQWSEACSLPAPLKAKQGLVKARTAKPKRQKQQGQRKQQHQQKEEHEQIQKSQQ